MTTPRDRTARWVQTHSSTKSDFYSPFLPAIDGLVPSSPTSEADSSHSLPPKMVLRYNDGSPDIPIPHPGPGQTESEFYPPSLPPVILPVVPSSPSSEADSSHSLPPKMVLRYNDGSPDIPIPHPGPGHGMGKQGLKVYRNSPSRRDHEFSSPEEIRTPPSGEVIISSRPSHARSKSPPRSSLRQRLPAPDVPFIPPPHLQTQSPYQGSSALGPQAISPPKQVRFAQPTHPWPPRHGHPKHTPPAIVYAPAHRSHQPHQPHYAPPAIFHHPPVMGPNGMIYSHSALEPGPGQYPYPTPHPSVMGGSSHHHSSSAHDIRGPGGRDLNHTPSLTGTEPASSLTTVRPGLM